MSDINSPPVKKPQVGIGFLIFCAIISGARAMDVETVVRHRPLVRDLHLVLHGAGGKVKEMIWGALHSALYVATGFVMIGLSVTKWGTETAMVYAIIGSLCIRVGKLIAKDES